LLCCEVQSASIDVWSAGIVFLCLLTGTRVWFKRMLNNKLGNLDALAQLISMFGVINIRRCASSLQKEVDCDVYVSTSKGGVHDPYAIQDIGITTILDIRSMSCKPDRFPLYMWSAVQACLVLSPLRRMSASVILRELSGFLHISVPLLPSELRATCVSTLNSCCTPARLKKLPPNSRSTVTLRVYDSYSLVSNSYPSRRLQESHEFAKDAWPMFSFDCCNPSVSPFVVGSQPKLPQQHLLRPILNHGHSGRKYCGLCRQYFSCSLEDHCGCITHLKYFLVKVCSDFFFLHLINNQLRTLMCLSK